MILNFKVFGKAGHAALDNGINAIYRALDVIKDLDSFTKKLSDECEVKLDFISMKGGTQHNIIPELCKLKAILQVDGIYTEKEILKKIKDMLPSYCKVTISKSKIVS